MTPSNSFAESPHARTGPLLYVLAIRSILVILSTLAVGVWVDDVSPAITGAAFGVSGGISVAWAAVTASERARRMLEQADEWAGAAPPTVRNTPQMVALVLLRLPLGVAVLWGLSQLSQLTGEEPDVLLGALAGLLAGLASRRFLLARAVDRWERRDGRTLLVDGLTVLGSEPKWVRRTARSDSGERTTRSPLKGS